MVKAMSALIRRLMDAKNWRFIGAFLALGFAWLLSTPPGAGVDESSHYVRAVGLGRGHLIGDEVPSDRPFEDFEGERLRRINAESGWFRISGMKPPPNGCNALNAGQPYDCVPSPAIPGSIEAVSLHGRSLPGAYVVPALASLSGKGTVSTTFLIRLGMLVQNAALLVVLVLALQTVVRHRELTMVWTMLGFCLTPVLLFLSATASPSSVETIAVSAFVASTVAAIRSRSVKWLTVGVGLAWVASWSRDLGAVAVVMALGSLFVVESDFGPWLRTVGRARWLVVAGMSGAVISAGIWQLMFKYPLDIDIGTPATIWRDSGAVLRTLRLGIGLGGWLNVPMDQLLESVWFLAFLGLFMLSISRVAMVVRWVFLFQGIVLMAVGLYLLTMLRAAGFGIQARFFMPLIAVVVVLLVTQVEFETFIFKAGHWRIAMGFLAVAHTSALLVAAHRHAHGLNGSPIDFGSAVWSPPGGWLWPAFFAVLGGALVASLPFPGRHQTV